MKTLQSEQLLKKLKAIWLDKTMLKSTDKQDILNTYGNYFELKEYEPMNKAIEVLQMKINYIPKFPELDREYHEHYQVPEKIKGEIECWVCLDRGYILYDLKVNNGYDQTSFYCPECDLGKFESGEVHIDEDGYTVPTKPVNHNRTQPISKYLAVGDIVTNNHKRYKGNGWTRDNTREVYFRHKKFEMTAEAKILYESIMADINKIGEGIGDL